MQWEAGDLWPLGRLVGMEECWQDLAIPRILHICLQEMAPDPGSLLHGGHITWGTALSTDKGGEGEV